MRSLPQVVLQRKDCRKNVREIPLLVARKKIKIDYFYWFSVSYRLVIEIGNPEIVYFSTTKHLKRQKKTENSRSAVNICKRSCLLGCGKMR